MTILNIILQAPSQGGGGYMNLIALTLIAMIIIVIVKTTKKVDDIPVVAEQDNKVVNVTLIGGIIGLFTSSSLNSLNNAIKRENANGWRVVQIIPADGGNIFLYIFRLLLLVITLFLFTTTNGYYIIMERK